MVSVLCHAGVVQRLERRTHKPQTVVRLHPPAQDVTFYYRSVLPIGDEKSSIHFPWFCIFDRVVCSLSDMGIRGRGVIYHTHG
jgi:hypothetical protein